MEFDEDPAIPWPRDAPTEIKNRKPHAFQPPGQEYDGLLADENAAVAKSFRAYQIVMLEQLKSALPKKVLAKEQELQHLYDSTRAQLSAIFETDPPLDSASKERDTQRAIAELERRWAAHKEELLFAPP